MTCDNAYILYVNGVVFGSGSDWTQAQTYSVPDGAVIAVYCHDLVSAVLGIFCASWLLCKQKV